MKKIALFARDPKNWVSCREMNWATYLKHYDNLGNLVWTYGIFKALQTPTNDLTLIDPIHPEISVDEINERFDHIVFSFANLIDPQKANRIRFLADIISRLKIPLTVCSVGVQSPDFGDYEFLKPIKQEAQRLFSKCLEHGVCIGTRGDFTTDCLSQLGFAKHTKTIGCPSFFINGPEFSISKTQRDEKNIKVAFNDTDATRSEIFEFSKKCQTENFSYITQGYPLRGEKDPIVLQLIAQKKLHLFGDFHSWNAFLKLFDLSISSRIHGTVMALLAGVPSAIITVDARTHEMADFFRIPKVSLTGLQQQPNASSLYESLNFNEINTNYSTLLNNYASFLSENGLNHFLTYPQDFIKNQLAHSLPPQVKDDHASSLVEFPKLSGWFMQTPAYRFITQMTAKF